MRLSLAVLPLERVSELVLPRVAVVVDGRRRPGDERRLLFAVDVKVELVDVFFRQSVHARAGRLGGGGGDGVDGVDGGVARGQVGDGRGDVVVGERVEDGFVRGRGSGWVPRRDVEDLDLLFAAGVVVGGDVALHHGARHLHLAGRLGPRGGARGGGDESGWCRGGESARARRLGFGPEGGKRRQRAEGTLRQRRERCRPDRRRGSRGRGRRCRRARGRVLALDGRRDKLIVQNLNLQIVEIVHRA